MIADVDNDGSAEILISSNNFRQGGSGWAGVTIFGHLGSGWAKSGPTWNVHDFAVTNINQDGSVPTQPEPPGRCTMSTERARQKMPWRLTSLPKLRTSALRAANQKALCELLHSLSIKEKQVCRRACPLSLFRKDGASLSFIAQSLTPDRIDSGKGGVGVEFQIQYQDIEGAEALVVRVDDWGAGFGAIEECDEWNNGIEMTDISCSP